MPRGIAYVTAGETVPEDLRTIDEGTEFSVTVVPGTDRGVASPLPEDTECVVVDHQPPAMDGLAATSWVSDRYTDVPVVLYPTESSESLAAAAVNADIDAFVPPNGNGNVGILQSQLQRLTGRTKATSGHSGAADDSIASTDDARMFESVLMSLPRWVSIYVKDRQGRHVAISGPEVAFDEDTVIQTSDGKVLHSRDDLLGKTDFDLYAQEHAKGTRQQEQRVMRTETPDVDVTETVDEPNGHVAHYSTTKAPWYDEQGNVAGIVGITVDITDRIERKYALERHNERLDRFAGVLSHDLRNPLALAKGKVELLGEFDLDGADDHVEDLEWSLDRIDTLIEDTLMLAREGATVTDSEPVALDNLAREAWRATDRDGGQLSVEDDLRTVSGDPDRIQRCLENLFTNALDHGRADERSTELTITVGHLENGFYVADDGDGIPEAKREQIFEHGFSTREEGTGFGLAIVEEIAVAHDWEVTVTEAADGGARFEFRGVGVVAAAEQ